MSRRNSQELNIPILTINFDNFVFPSSHSKTQQQGGRRRTPVHPDSALKTLRHVHELEDQISALQEKVALLEIGLENQHTLQEKVRSLETALENQRALTKMLVSKKEGEWTELRQVNESLQEENRSLKGRNSALLTVIKRHHLEFDIPAGNSPQKPGSPSMKSSSQLFRLPQAPASGAPSSARMHRNS